VKVKVTEILSLRPQDKERLNSHALKRFNDWQDRIMRETPQLRQLNIEQIRADLDTYLHDDERVEFNNCLADITRWLSGCMDTGDGYFPYAYDTRVIGPMFRVESLLIEAYQAKEAEEKWNAACKAVNPPLSDAKMYFGDEEYEGFIKAARQAIHVYTEKGEDYLSDVGSLDYCRYLERIRNRKEKERQLFLAKLAAQEFNRRLNEEKVRLQALLSPNRKATESYFRKQVRDRRYTGQNFFGCYPGRKSRISIRYLLELAGIRQRNLCLMTSVPSLPVNAGGLFSFCLQPTISWKRSRVWVSYSMSSPLLRPACG